MTGTIRGVVVARDGLPDLILTADELLAEHGHVPSPTARRHAAQTVAPDAETIIQTLTRHWRKAARSAEVGGQYMAGSRDAYAFAIYRITGTWPTDDGTTT